MSQRQENNSVGFETPEKEKRNFKNSSDYGLLDSNSEKMQENQKNPFATFLNSPSVEKSIFFSQSPKQFVEQKEQSEQSEDDVIIQKWENNLKKKNQIISKENQKQKLCFVKNRRQSKRRMGKLLMINLNEKNSKKLIFHPEERTLMPIPYCQNCEEVFENFAAVGGHKRLCKNPLVKRRAEKSEKQKQE